MVLDRCAIQSFVVLSATDDLSQCVLISNALTISMETKWHLLYYITRDFATRGFATRVEKNYLL